MFYLVVYGSSSRRVNPYPAMLINFNFQTLEVVSRYRDPQPQVTENYCIPAHNVHARIRENCLF